LHPQIRKGCYFSLYLKLKTFKKYPRRVKVNSKIIKNPKKIKKRIKMDKKSISAYRFTQ